MPGEFSERLCNIFFQSGLEDGWKWLLTPEKGYIVRVVYQMFTTVEVMQQNEFHNLIRNKAVPLKVSVYAWRLLQKQLPTKDNFVKQGIIQQNANVCASGYDNDENTDHLFLGREVFGSISLLVRR